jgi:hypothetical protein
MGCLSDPVEQALGGVAGAACGWERPKAMSGLVMSGLVFDAAQPLGSER